MDWTRRDLISSSCRNAGGKISNLIYRRGGRAEGSLFRRENINLSKIRGYLGIRTRVNDSLEGKKRKGRKRRKGNGEVGKNYGNWADRLRSPVTRPVT